MSRTIYRTVGVNEPGPVTAGIAAHVERIGRDNSDIIAVLRQDPRIFQLGVLDHAFGEAVAVTLKLNNFLFAAPQHNGSIWNGHAAAAIHGVGQQLAGRCLGD